MRSASDGAKLWPLADGTPVPGAAGIAQVSPTICPDLDGGAIVAWSEFRSSNGPDVWASHILTGARSIQELPLPRPSAACFS
jgi:hypothetical protein